MPGVARSPLDHPGLCGLLDDPAVAAGERMDPACWQVMFDELMGRVAAARFGRVESRRRVRAFVAGLLGAGGLGCRRRS